MFAQIGARLNSWPFERLQRDGLVLTNLSVVKAPTKHRKVGIMILLVDGPLSKLLR